KPVNAVCARKLGLAAAHIFRAQIIVAELPRLDGLTMTNKHRAGLGDVGPLGEPMTPPFVVLGNLVVLRKIKGDRAHAVLAPQRLLPAMKKRRLVDGDDRALVEPAFCARG